MTGIDRLIEVMGRDFDLDDIERDNLLSDAADEIERLRADNEKLLAICEKGEK